MPRPGILIREDMRNPEFDSDARRRGIDRLSQLGELSYYAGELTGELGSGVLGVIASGALIHPEFYEAAADLRIVARYGVGFEKVNLQLATEHGVIVTLAPEHIESVAEYAVTQWLATLKRVYTLNRNSHGGDYATICTYEASGTTLGVYGFGRIGQAVARLAKPLLGAEGRLLVYDIRADISQLAESFGAEAVDDPLTLFQESDTITLHVAGDDTIVNYERFRAMKPHASLINAARGSLVDDEAAHRAVEEERLFYYVVDDPVNGPRELYRNHPRIICTNHNAGITAQSAVRLDARCIGQVSDAFQGRTPAQVLNADVLQHPRTMDFLRAQ